MLSWLSVLSRRGLGRECHSGRSYANLLCFVVIFFLLVENNAINDFGNCLAGSLRLCTVTRFIWSFFSLVTHYFKSGYLLRKLFQITAEKSP